MRSIAVDLGPACALAGDGIKDILVGLTVIADKGLLHQLVVGIVVRRVGSIGRY